MNYCRSQTSLDARLVDLMGQYWESIEVTNVMEPIWNYYHPDIWNWNYYHTEILNPQKPTSTQLCEKTATLLVHRAQVSYVCRVEIPMKILRWKCAVALQHHSYHSQHGQPPCVFPMLDLQHTWRWSHICTKPKQSAILKEFLLVSPSKQDHKLH